MRGLHNSFCVCCVNRLPAKPVLRSSSSVQEQSTTRISSSESLVSSSYEQLATNEEPYYDMVPAEDEALTQSKYICTCILHF